MSEAFRIIRDTDGWKGLRRGMAPRVLTVAPSTAISWMSYEFFSEWTGQPHRMDLADLRRGVDQARGTYA
jgi:hypothetical protein